MKKNLIIAISMMLVLCCGCSALAQHFVLDGEKASLPVKNAATGEEMTIDVSEINVIGLVDETKVALFYNGKVCYMDAGLFMDTFPVIDLYNIGDASTIPTAYPGCDMDRAIQIQQMLVELERLNTADGLYGNGTAASVAAVQEEVGLEGTGNTDGLTYLTLKAMTNTENTETIKFPNIVTAEDKFGSYPEDFGLDLSAFTDRMWHFSYDQFEQKGELDPDITIGELSLNRSDLDRIAFKCKVTVCTKSDVDHAIPCLKIVSEGAYRPYIRGAYIGIGNQSYKLENADITGGISGTNVKETAYVPMTAEALNALKDAQTVTVRVIGTNANFDITCNVEGGKMDKYIEACGVNG